METDAGIELTSEEVKLIESFKRLAKKWEKHGKRLWIYSASGSLMVMMNEGNGNPHPRMVSGRLGGGVNQENMITEIKIQNDGGDW